MTRAVSLAKRSALVLLCSACGSATGPVASSVDRQPVDTAHVSSSTSITAGVSDVDLRRAMYDAFPVFPGAELLSSTSYELRADGNPTGRFALTVVFALPPSVRSDDVLDFLRASIPAGWIEATDETCAAAAARFPPPPTMSAPTGTASPSNSLPSTTAAPAFVLMNRHSQLTVFAPDTGGGVDGITFSLSRAGNDKLLTLDQPTYACGPIEPDRTAEDFDAP